ncbi:hypothetical protein [Streptomyces sp. IBSBF 2806]|uniref:hypothetical protein n=1 Tax=Streptomyces sp. IBSBF 2806 TaxID=2903529 RepID=UPI002FDBA689
MYASTVIVTGAGRGFRRALTAEPPRPGAAVHAGARNADLAAFGHASADVPQWVVRYGGGTP